MPAIAEKHREEALVITLYNVNLVFARDVTPATQAFRSELARVLTADPVLISGRAAWRASDRSIEAAPEPGDLCATLAAWRRAGHPKSTVRKTMRDLESVATGGPDVSRKLGAAARRLISLDVPREEARLFASPYRDPESLVEIG